MATPSDTTDNHSLQLWSQVAESDEEWEHRTDMNIIEKALPIQDVESNRSSYTPHSGAMFHATDTEAMYIGDGSSWLDVPSRGAAAVFDSVQTDLLQDGSNPAETISGTGASLQFTGNDSRDIHDATDVSLSNSSGASVTEDVTVDYYEGVDNTGTLLDSETQSVSLSDGASTTVTFLTADFALDNIDYYIEVTTTDLTSDSIDEHTLGAEYTFEQDSTGDLVMTDQNGRERARYDATSGELSLPSASVTNDLDVGGTVAASTDVTVGGDSVATDVDLSNHAGDSSAHHSRPSAGTHLTENSGAFDVTGTASHDNTSHSTDYASQTSLDNHTSDTTNPHSVTASQANALPDTGGTVTGDVSIDGNFLTDANRLDFNDRAGSGSPPGVQVTTGNDVDLEITNTGQQYAVRDTVNAFDVATFAEGGAVGIPNGALSVSGNITTGGDDVVSSSSGNYDIQKNGTDGSGIINFKT